MFFLLLPSKNLRQDCASIYHVIEHLSDSKTKTIQNNRSSDAIKEARRKILNNSSKLSDDFNPFSSSSSSLIAHRSIATSESSTQDLLLEERKPEALIPTGKNDRESEGSVCVWFSRR